MILNGVGKVTGTGVETADGRGCWHDTRFVGIGLNAVPPGLIDTAMHASAGLPNQEVEPGPTVPLGRAGQPFEVAEAILWSLSEQQVMSLE